MFFLISVNATHFDSFGKLVYNSPDYVANAVMKKVGVVGWEHLVLFSIRPIQKGVELRYNYGESDLTWWKNVNILYLLYFVNYWEHHKDHLKICSPF